MARDNEGSSTFGKVVKGALVLGAAGLAGGAGYEYFTGEDVGQLVGGMAEIGGIQNSKVTAAFNSIMARSTDVNILAIQEKLVALADYPDKLKEYLAKLVEADIPESIRAQVNILKGAFATNTWFDAYKAAHANAASYTNELVIGGAGGAVAGGVMGAMRGGKEAKGPHSAAILAQREAAARRPQTLGA